jgi:hypothetical protein
VGGKIFIVRGKKTRDPGTCAPEKLRLGISISCTKLQNLDNKKASANKCLIIGFGQFV